MEITDITISYHVQAERKLGGCCTVCGKKYTDELPRAKETFMTFDVCRDCNTNLSEALNILVTGKLTIGEDDQSEKNKLYNLCKKLSNYDFATETQDYLFVIYIQTIILSIEAKLSSGPEDFWHSASIDKEWLIEIKTNLELALARNKTWPK